MQTQTTKRFRELLVRPELLVMSGGFSPLHARMSEVVGYDAFFMSGSQVAAYVYGYPDVGLLGLSEMVDAVRRLTNACSIPIFADADTGGRSSSPEGRTARAHPCRRRGLAHRRSGGAEKVRNARRKAFDLA